MEKLYSAVSLINDYADFPDFPAEKEYLMLPAGIFTISWVLYILRIRSQAILRMQFKREKEVFFVLDGQSVVDIISDGIAICNKGLLKLIKVVSENNSIKNKPLF